MNAMAKVRIRSVLEKIGAQFIVSPNDLITMTSDLENYKHLQRENVMDNFIQFCGEDFIAFRLAIKSADDDLVNMERDDDTQT